jgi:putative membrane protein
MGLGTFPSFMQFPIVQFLSYLTPFHYMIQIQGAIIYGVTGNVAGTTLYVFENIGILLIFAGLFLTLGLWQAHKREREIFYGTCSSKKLSIVLKQMNLSQYLDEKSRVV